MSVLLNITQAVDGIRHEVSLLNMSPPVAAATSGANESLSLTQGVSLLAGISGLLASLEADPFDADIRNDVVSSMSLATTAAGKLTPALLDFQEMYIEPSVVSQEIISFAGTMSSIFSSIEADISTLPGGAGFTAQHDEFFVFLQNLRNGWNAISSSTELVESSTATVLPSVDLLSEAIDAFLLETEDPVLAEELRAAAQEQAGITLEDTGNAAIAWNHLKNYTADFPNQVQLMTQTPFYKSGLLDAGIALAESLIEEINQYLTDGPTAISEILRAVGGIENVSVLHDVADQMRIIIERLGRA